MAKIFSILTLIVAGIAIWLALEGDKRVKEMQESGRKAVSNLKTVEGVYKTTKAELDTTKTNLETSQKELASTKESLRTTQDSLATAEKNYKESKAQLDDQTTKLAEMKKSLEEMFPGVDFAQGIASMKTAIDQLKAKTTEQEAQIGELTKTKATLESKVADLESTRTANEAKLVSQGSTIKKYTENIMIKGVRGRVEAVNAGWGFCVVSIGDKQGAASNKVLIVSRNGQAIGKVRITNVEASQSVADILPNTFVRGTSVQPGDSVIYTGEDKAAVDVPAAPAAGATPVPELPRQ